MLRTRPHASGGRGGAACPRVVRCRNSRLSGSRSQPPPERVDRDWRWRCDRQRHQGLHPRQRFEFDHPLVGPLAGAVSITLDDDGGPIGDEDAEGDLCGHGTPAPGSSARSHPRRRSTPYACSAPGSRDRPVPLAACAGGRQSSMSSTEPLEERSASSARSSTSCRQRYFRHDPRRLGAHMPVESYPCVSPPPVRRQPRRARPLLYYANPDRGRGLRGVGSTSRSRGSAAARSQPPATARDAVHLGNRGAHPQQTPVLTPFQLKTVLYLTSAR